MKSFTNSTGAMDKTLKIELEKQATALGSDIKSREYALAMDKQDPHHHFRDMFYYPKMKDLPEVDLGVVDPEEDCIYFCGNSLGLCAKQSREMINKTLDDWSHYGVYGHTTGEIPWASADLCVDEQMAVIVGAKRDEVCIMNGLTVNLHMLLLSVYEPTPSRHKILLEAKAFPSDHYTVESQIRLKGLDPKSSMLCIEPKEGSECIEMADILKCIEEEGDSIAVVMFSGIQYYTGQRFDMQAITAAAHKKGIMVGFDLAHAVGNVPLKLHDWDVDFACWCTYKYLCAGPGCIAGAFLHEKHMNTIKPKLQGWWGHKGETRFVMDNNMDLTPGIKGFRLSNPPGLECASLKGALNVYSLTSIEELNVKSRLLTGYLEYLVRHYFSKESGSDPFIDIFTPSDPAQRGCQLSLCFSIPVSTIFSYLTKHGIVCDERMPSVIRIAPKHIYNSFQDVYRFIQALRTIMTQSMNGH